jgi:type VI secretion system protein ImpK
MGDYRCRADGAQALEQVRRRLLAMLGGDTQPVCVAPHARVACPPRPRRPWLGALPYAVPVLGLSVLAVCGWAWRGQAQQESSALRDQLLGLRAQAEAALARGGPDAAAHGASQQPSVDPAVDPRAWLDTPLRAGQLELRPEAGGWRIGLRGAPMFAQGSSEIDPGLSVLLRQIAAMARAHGGQLLVLGYTDATSRHADPAGNQALSQRRADAVAARLVHEGVDASHVRALGRASADPLGDNATAGGRARNRRVEIVLRDGAGAAP